MNSENIETLFENALRPRSLLGEVCSESVFESTDVEYVVGRYEGEEEHALVVCLKDGRYAYLHDSTVEFQEMGECVVSNDLEELLKFGVPRRMRDKLTYCV